MNTTHEPGHRENHITINHKYGNTHKITMAIFTLICDWERHNFRVGEGQLIIIITYIDGMCDGTPQIISLLTHNWIHHRYDNIFNQVTILIRWSTADVLCVTTSRDLRDKLHVLIAV